MGRFEITDPKDGFLNLDFDKDLKSVLKNLGYKQKEIEDTVKNLPEKSEKLEERLRAALRILGKK